MSKIIISFDTKIAICTKRLITNFEHMVFNFGHLIFGLSNFGLLKFWFIDFRSIDPDPKEKPLIYIVFVELGQSHY